MAKDLWRAEYNRKQMDKLEEMMACLTVCQQLLVTVENVKPLEKMDWAQIELEEHGVLEGLMEDLGIKGCSIGGRVEIDYEEEMEYLERVLDSDGMGEREDGTGMGNKMEMMTTDKVQNTIGIVVNMGEGEYDWMVRKETSNSVEFEINIEAYYSMGTLQFTGPTDNTYQSTPLK